MAVNPRFADYVTSGAFNLSLSRHQVAAVSLLVGAGEESCFSGPGLERKGLAEAITGRLGDRERVEYRLTNAGLICAALLAEAGLTNGPADPHAIEIADLHAQLSEARETARDWQERGWSAMARKEAADREIEQLRAEIAALKDRDNPRALRLKPEFANTHYAEPVIVRRDKMPDVPDAELCPKSPGPDGASPYASTTTSADTPHD